MEVSVEKWVTLLVRVLSQGPDLCQMAAPMLHASLRPRVPGSSPAGHRSASCAGVSGPVPLPGKSSCSSSRSPAHPARELSRGSQSWSRPAVALQSVDLTDEERDGLSKHPNSAYCVVIAGAGIGGLVLAVSLLKRGFRVKVLERDLTAIRGEGKYRGPIQVCCCVAVHLHLTDSFPLSTQSMHWKQQLQG